MAEHMHDIKRRIKSISSTERITNAMKLVSASKLRKAKAAYENSRGYMSGVLDDIRGVFEDIEDIPEVFVEGSREIKNRCYVLITSSNGLCGSFNSNVIKTLEAELARDNAGRDNALLVTIGTKGRDYFLRRGYQLLMTHDAPADTVDYAETRKISEPLIRMYLDGKIDEIKIVYTRYINTLRQEPAAVQLLPVKRENIDSLAEEKKLNHVIEYSPSPEEVFNYLVPMYLELTVFSVCMESATCEYAARRSAMENANDSARDMLSSLQTEYNHARQSAITDEIIEIVAGSEAQK